MGGGLESRVYGADGARHHPHRTHAVVCSGKSPKNTIRPSKTWPVPVVSILLN